MKQTFRQSLAAMPARQLNLVAIGTIAIAAALAWTLAIRAPLAAMRQQQTRLASLKAAHAGSAARRAPAVPAGAVPALPVPPAPLELIAAVSGSAHDAGLAVGGAVPGGQRSVAGLRQHTLDIEASGSYGAILAWLADIEARQPTVGIVRMNLRPAPEEPRRVVQLQLGAYEAEIKR